MADLHQAGAGEGARHGTTRTRHAVTGQRSYRTATGYSTLASSPPEWGTAPCVAPTFCVRSSDRNLQAFHQG